MQNAARPLVLAFVWFQVGGFLILLQVFQVQGSPLVLAQGLVHRKPETAPELSTPSNPNAFDPRPFTLRVHKFSNPLSFFGGSLSSKAEKSKSPRKDVKVW